MSRQHRSNYSGPSFISQPLPVIIPIHWLFRSPRCFYKRFRTVFTDDRCVIPKDGESVPL
ncbi:MAG: hypothetical protein ACXADY_17220 [Candidatus Hodarchaeales archaeon]